MILRIQSILEDLLKENANKDKLIHVVIDTTNNHYEGNLSLTSIDDIEDDCIIITEARTNKYANLKTMILKSSITAFSYRIDNLRDD